MPRLNPASPFTRIALVACLTTGCTSPPQIEPQRGTEALMLESFFAGRTEGEGVFRNSWTGSERRFKVAIEGGWDGETLTLVEDFTFADGERDRKTWHLRRTSNSTFAGRRDDLVGEAMVWRDGKAMRMVYSVKLAGWTVDFMDVLALREDGTLLNRATVGKWGLRLARVELVLRKATTQ